MTVYNVFNTRNKYAKLICSVFLTLLIALFFVNSNLKAESASTEEMDMVCQNWLQVHLYKFGSWGESTAPGIINAEDVTVEGQLVGRLYQIAPSGFVLVPAIKELPPVKAYSDVSDLDVSEAQGMMQMLVDVLKDRTTRYVEQYGSLDALQTDNADNPHRELWDVFTENKGGLFENLSLDGPGGGEDGEILLYPNAWHQGDPYNMYCPMGSSGRCVVGCVATAATQIMHYWQWPPSGTGSHGYWWSGDGTGSKYLTADFSDEYDWANMPDDCNGGCSQAEKEALAELAYEVGVAHEMDYGSDASGAWPSMDVWIDYFRYDPSMTFQHRNSYSAQGWFDLMKSELIAGRPMPYVIPTHAIAVDGWQIVSNVNMIHINYGWGGYKTAWYAIDNLYYVGGTGTEYLFSNVMPIQDADDDGYFNDEDNCPIEYNPDQADVDGDGVGDVCDNCVNNYNPEQGDANGNGIGDYCDPDADSDGFINEEDNCWLVGNVGQDDDDEDGVGNACDNCPDTPNPGQHDSNEDGIGDACDGALHITGDEPPDGFYSYDYFYAFEGVGGVPPYHWARVFGAQIPYGCTFNGDTVGTITGVPNWPSTFVFKVQMMDSGDPVLVDTGIFVITIHSPDSVCFDQDGDGFGDSGHSDNNCPLDNCPTAYNPDQADYDSDGIGDICDECPEDADNDIDMDGYCASEDNCPTVYNPDQADLNGNNVGDVCEGMCGDANSDDKCNVSDAVFIIGYVFSGGEAPNPLSKCDVNCDEKCNVSDAVFLINYVFTQGPLPCSCQE